MATCGDAGGRICDLIGAGLTCDRDFCSTCGHAGECDLTCGFCQSTERERGCNDLLSACPTLVESFGCDSSLEPLAHGTGADVCPVTCNACSPSKQGHRRAQINLENTCSALNLQPRVEAVNAACCDDNACAESATANGVP